MSLALFTVVDLETTGLAPPASIIEVGVTRLYFDTETKAFEIKPPWSRLFSPRSFGELTPENLAVHHLTREHLLGHEPCSEEALAAVMQQDRPQFVCAANAAFEMQWLDKPDILGADLSGRPPFWLCTVKAAARLYPDAESHSNQAMRYRLGLSLPEELAMPPHRAGPDSFVTAHILGRFLSEGVRVSQMVQWTREPRFMTKIKFGKHKGTAWEDLPTDYMEWMLSQADLDADAKFWAARELERRKAAA